MFGFGVEVEKSLIFHKHIKIGIGGRAGRELAGNREEKVRERETQNLNFFVKFGAKYIFHKKISLRSRGLTGVAGAE